MHNSVKHARRCRALTMRLVTPARLTWFSLVLLAIFHGGLYASYLPPWGLIDEEQHVHYIQLLAEEQSLPVVGQTYLSSDIINSLFETRRWEVFHWPTPVSREPREIGFEGHSYQGYQPPLFYILFAPLYAILPGDMLTKVYGLRWAIVALSLLTVWIAYRITRELFPQWPLLPYLVCLILVVLPERTASVSRVNNDVLLEIIAAAFIWVCVRIVLNGISARRSLWLGWLFGLGVLTKMSMAGLVIMVAFAFWSNRRRQGFWRYAALAIGMSTLVIAPLVARNFWLYGDGTGLSSFLIIRGRYDTVMNLETVVSASIDLFRHFWVVWWKGASPASNPVLNVIWILLAGLSIWSAIGLTKFYLRQRKAGEQIERTQVVLMFVLAILGFGISTLGVYLLGVEPVIQGRFLLPVIVPLVILFCLGLYNGQYGNIALLATGCLLVVLDMLSLFGNLVPYYYYWSAFVDGGRPQPYSPLNLQEAMAMLYPRLLADKPVWLQPLLKWLVLLYVGTLAFVAATTRNLTQAVQLSEPSGETAA